MLTIRYTVIHYDVNRPELVIKQTTGHTLDVNHPLDFGLAAVTLWPSPLYKVIADPGQDVPGY